MEIIKKGKVPDENVKTTCQKCGTVFKFHPSEVETVDDQRSELYYKINCPFCGNNFTKNVSQ